MRFRSGTAVGEKIDRPCHRMGGEWVSKREVAVLKSGENHGAWRFSDGCCDLALFALPFIFGTTNFKKLNQDGSALIDWPISRGMPWRRSIWRCLRGLSAFALARLRRDESAYLRWRGYGVTSPPICAGAATA